MSTVKILGIKEAQGEFEGKPYHSIKLHVAETFTDANCYGMETSIQTVKYENIPFVFGRPISISELVTYINSEADFSYDKRGKVQNIHLLADDYQPEKKK